MKFGTGLKNTIVYYGQATAPKTTLKERQYY